MEYGSSVMPLTLLLLASAAGAVDTTPPTGTIIINNGRTATKSADVTLALTWADEAGGSGVSRLRFSNDGATWSAWEALINPKAHPLHGADGYKTVRVQFMDRALNKSAIYNDYIRLDTVAPTGGIIINGGATTTTGLNVTLNLNWADSGSGVTRMRFSDNGSTWTAWEAVKPSRAHTLPAGIGYHTVRVQYTDAAENYSHIYNDYIKLVSLEETIMLPGNVPLTMVWVPPRCAVALRNALVFEAALHSCLRSGTSRPLALRNATAQREDSADSYDSHTLCHSRDKFAIFILDCGGRA